MLGGSPAKMVEEPTYFVATEAATPMARPPNQVSGRLENPPMAAAPKAWTIRSVSTTGSRSTEGARSIPDSETKKHPATQAQRRTDVALTPVRSTSDRVVDDGPHLPADLRGAKEQVEGGHQSGRDPEDDRLVVADVHPAQAEGLGRKVLGEQLRGRSVNEEVGGLDHQNQADGGDDPERQRHLREPLPQTFE